MRELHRPGWQDPSIHGAANKQGTIHSLMHIAANLSKERLLGLLLHEWGGRGGGKGGDNGKGERHPFCHRHTLVGIK